MNIESKNFHNRNLPLLSLKWGANIVDCIEEAGKMSEREQTAIYFVHNEKIYCCDPAGHFYRYILDK